jgi:Leucine-rich repeat (LRR) protein
MNKIGVIRGVIDCPILTYLRLSDNQIKDIPQQML